MRILVCGLNNWPEPIGVGRFTGEFVAHLAASGHEVRALSAPPYYPYWRVFDGYRMGRYRTETRSGVVFQRCPTWVPRKPTGLKRILHLSSFAISSAPPLIWHGLRWRPDLVVAVEPTLLSAPFAWMAGRLIGARTWLHVQDLEFDAAFDLGVLKGPVWHRAVAFFERLLLRRFDHLTTISPRMREKLIAKGVDPRKCELMPNWVDTDRIRPLGRPSRLRKELGFGEQDVVALYSGNMNAKQGLSMLVRAAGALENHDSIRFVLAGDGPSRSALRRAMKELSNVRMLPLQPEERLNELLNLADIHVLPQRDGATDLVMPSKLGGMFASGRPVVAAARPGSQLWESVQECGAAVLPEDFGAMATQIRRLADDLPLRVRLGANARRKAELEWSRRGIMLGLEERLNGRPSLTDSPTHARTEARRMARTG